MMASAIAPAPIVETTPKPMPKSHCRIFAAYFWKIRDALRTLGTMLSNYLYGKLENTLTQKQIDQLTQEGNNTLAAITLIRNRGSLAPSALDTYLSALEKEHPMFKAIPSMSRGFPVLPARGALGGIRFLGIPLVVSNRLRDHVVIFFIDLVRNKIDYYDPKGLTINDRAGEPLLADSKIDLPEAFKQISAAYADGSTVLRENTYKHQADAHNCGVYVAEFTRRKLLRGDNEEATAYIFEHGASFEDANNRIRREMIQKIYLNACAILDPPAAPQQPAQANPNAGGADPAPVPEIAVPADPNAGGAGPAPAQDPERADPQPASKPLVRPTLWQRASRMAEAPLKAVAAPIDWICGFAVRQLVPNISPV